MKAIQTRYLPWTTTKPARIKASAEGVPSRIFSVDALENETGNTHRDDTHACAARKLADEYRWNGTLASGQLPNGDWAHCFIPSKP